MPENTGMETIWHRLVDWYLGTRRVRVEMQLRRVERYHA